MISIPAMKYKFYILCTMDITMLLLSDYPKTVYLYALFPEKLFSDLVLFLACHEIGWIPLIRYHYQIFLFV